MTSFALLWNKLSSPLRSRREQKGGRILSPLLLQGGKEGGLPVLFSALIWILISLGLIITGCTHWARRPEPTPKIYDTRAVELFVEATIAEELQDYYRAVVLYQEALRRDSTAVTIHLALAGLHQHLGQTESALQHLKTAANLSPDDPDILEWIVQAYGDQEQWDEQKPYLKHLLELNPKSVTYNLQLANVYLKTNDRKSAQKLFRKAVNLAQNNKDQLLRLGAVLILNDEPDLALICYQHVSRLDSTNDQVNYTLGRLYLNSDNDQEARIQIEKAIALNDTSVRYWVILASIDLDADKYDQAEQTIQKALKSLPNHPQLLNLLGTVYERQHRYDEALQILNQSIALDTTSVAPYITIGFVYDETDQFDLAESTYKKALEIDNDNPTVLNNYAYLLATRKTRLQEALQMSSRAIEQVPDNSSYLDTMGWIYFQMGNSEKALEYLLKAKDLDEEGSRELFEHIGDVYKAMGDTKNARKYWKHALKFEPDNITLKDKLKT
jgi:Tfp pilus assembly protein PilF